jgi:hypothetical protein
MSIHAVEMLDYGDFCRQVAGAVWAVVVKSASDQFFVFWAVNFSRPALTDLAA